MSASTGAPVVAILGTRYDDFSIEERALGPLGARIVSAAGPSRDEIVAVAGEADAILAGSGPSFDEGTLDALRCRAIVRYGVGTETIDLDAAARRGIVVANVPDYGTEAVSVHALTLILAALRRIPQADAIVRSGDWGFAPMRPLHLPSALVAGVIGFGRIGRATAELLADVGFSVLAYDAFREVRHPDPSIVESGVADLLTSSDVVTLHAPGRADGTPLIGAPEIALMKRGSILVNTARGSLVDLDALSDGLRAGRPAFAALDVYPEEPPDVSVLAGLEDRTLLTPHMAWYSEESERDLREKAVAEVVRVLSGRAPLNPVAPAGVSA